MPPFHPIPPHPGRPAAPGHAPDRMVDFRSSTLQPDPDDPNSFMRSPLRPARPGWLIGTLLVTVVLLTLAVAGLAWQLH